MKLRKVLDKGNPKNKKEAYDFFVKEKGYSPKVALGIIGNLMQESHVNLDTSAIGFDGTGSFGIAQWLGPRKSKLKEVRPDDFNTLRGQLEFIDWELNNTEKRAASKLKNSNTIEDAALVFSKYYERPHKDYAHNEKRISYAQNLGKEFGVEDSEKKPEKPTKKVDSQVPSLATQPINPTYATLPEVKKTEKKESGISEDQLRQLLKQERQASEQRFLNAINSQSKTTQEQQYVPEAQENLDHLYQYVNIDNFSDGGKYTIKKGDTLSKIAKSKGVSVESLVSKNNISNPNNISIGQELSFEDNIKNSPSEIPELLSSTPSSNFVGPRMSEEETAIQHLPEVIITHNRTQYKREKEIEESKKIDTKYKNNRYNSGISIPKGTENVKTVQNFLVEKGYDLDPKNKFGNNGVDGQLGNITRSAIEDYNSKSGNVSPYKSLKKKQGKLGECTETQCSEYVQNEIFRNAGKGDRDAWNKKSGITGDAWTIGKNIVDKGGTEIGKDNVRGGDVVTIHVKGSKYQDRADKAGTGTTHTAVVDEVNNDGSYYILHNVHGVRKNDSGKEEYYGREYRTKVDPDGNDTYFKDFTVKNAFRPNYSGGAVEKVTVRDDVNIHVNPNVKVSEDYTKAIQNVDFKNKLVNREGIDEDEYYSLSKAALGIMGQETKFGEDVTYKTGAKRAGATTAKFLGLKENEVSLGPGSMKLDTNFNSADIGLYGVNKDNITDPKNAMKATMLKLSRNYKQMIKKGYSKEDSLYRAIQKYNGGLKTVSNGKTREEWAKDYDLDYVNKVINFGANFKLSSDKDKFFTTFDTLTTKNNVVKWNKYVEKELQ